MPSAETSGHHGVPVADDLVTTDEQSQAVQDVVNGLAVLVIPFAAVAYSDGRSVEFPGVEAQDVARRILCRGPTPALPLPAHAVR
jgi:hypothetical protein